MIQGYRSDTYSGALVNASAPESTTMKLGDILTVTQVYKRRTRYQQNGKRPDTTLKVWEAWPIKERQAIYLGLRTLCNGVREWEDEVGGIFIPDKDGHFQAMLVCFSTRENPVYVPVQP